MRKIWFVTNVRSGSYDAALCEAIVGALSAGSCMVERVVRFPEDPLPTLAEVEAAGLDEIAIFTGDGTINALTRAMAGWHGALLVLPGGTMNLLARALHGDSTAEDIARASCGTARQVERIPVIEQGEAFALVGAIVGPTTLWGDVRESMRDWDVAAMATAFGEAWTGTFSGSRVRVRGMAEDYPAIFIEADADRLRMTGFTADGIGELFGHAAAWMNGDFREGPSVDLGGSSEAVIESDGTTLGLMLDGEKEDCAPPARFRHAMSPVAFVRTVPAVGKRAA